MILLIAVYLKNETSFFMDWSFLYLQRRIYTEYRYSLPKQDSCMKWQNVDWYYMKNVESQILRRKS